MTLSIEFQRLRQEGRKSDRKVALAKARSGHLLCLCLNITQSGGRFETPVMEVGVVASKKQVSKKAVVRNFVKRRIRAALTGTDTQKLSEMAKDQGWMHMRILIVSNKECAAADFSSLTASLNHGLQKIFSLLKNSNGANFGHSSGILQ